MGQVLQARVEEVIKEFNEAMEQGEARMSNIKMAVMKEAKALIAALEDAEAKRQEELGRKMNELIEKLTGDLEVILLLPLLFAISVIPRRDLYYHHYDPQ